jgi:hypothetical protein
MEELDGTTTHYPDWYPFDGTNEKFIRTPAEPRLPPPVILANKTIVFRHASAHYPEWHSFDTSNECFMRTPAEPRLPPPVILGNKTIVFKHALKR